MLGKTGLRIQIGIVTAAWVAIGVLVGCGGNSGSGPNDSSAAPGACLASFEPNYGSELVVAPDVTGATRLLKWVAFPLNIYFEHNAYWTQALEDASKVGINAWNTATNGQVTWQETTVASNAQITVVFEPDAALPTGALGETQDSYDQSTGLIYAATLSIGADSFNADNVSGFEQTCAHEFGHALGIAGHSPNQGDLMYFAQLAASPSQPTQNDLNTLLGDYCDTFPTNNHSAIEARQVVGPVRTITLY
jgi:hypothetical protein